MIPIPAIDLRGGKVVRLSRGDFREETVYPERPERVAARFEAEGASRIHVVDLDGALGGKPRNLGAVEALLGKIKIPVEVGGGIRDLKTAADYFERGARWVILGTRACLDGGFLKEAVSEYREKIIVGIDALGGRVATDGWTKVTKIPAAELAKKTEALGGRTVIYTDISKDGLLGGPNLKAVKALAEAVAIDVIASGGVGSIGDVRDLVALKQANLLGVIIGKALYEKKLNLADAVKTCLQKE
ncbi:MAG: 1-(5-phosphoribosyl)-5-[(5-phosphoribosylamino)methylideneamino]imidazole-4-carboxamide isomerase [Candidatus Omnitrophica bacterium]|nr:1-(5-phosphoribosyl)-5-[(5-phosphoribosylamino)methylideneamino]imidazole-4-carboxamide isomerase [Candidatus Omnitrophota bacterium]